MSGALNRQLNTIAGRSKHAAVAAAAAAARHHGRAPSSTSALLASVARNSSSSLAGCYAGDNTEGATTNTTTNAAAANTNVAYRNRLDSVRGCEDDAGWRRGPVSASAASAATVHGSSGAKRAVSSVAASASSASASAPSPSLLAPAASAYSSSSLLPSATDGDSTGATRVDAVVVGAGQAGLSVAYHLQKAGGLRVVALDANQVCMHVSRSCVHHGCMKVGGRRKKGLGWKGWGMTEGNGSSSLVNAWPAAHSPT